MASVTHTINADQRFIELSFDRTASGLTVAAPTGPAAAPPGYYMLFLLSRDGVPSVARVVRLRPPERAPR
jgi:hypothetical protein